MTVALMRFATTIAAGQATSITLEATSPMR
jgi:hypothetical protein